jgi:hypothetical protein
MIIKDLEGRSFEIRDLEGTITLQYSFLSYIKDQKTPSQKRLEERRIQYWQDFKEKIMIAKFRLHLKA